MIVQEYFKTRDDGVVLVKTYSTENKYIQKVGTEEVQGVAIDTEDEVVCGHRKYIELDKVIECEPFLQDILQDDFS